MNISGASESAQVKEEEGPSMFATLLQAWRAHWRNACYWGLCSLLGGLLPLWITIFVRRILERPLDFQSFVLRGDPVLYAAAFFAPAIYQVWVRSRDRGTILGMGAVILSILSLLISTIVFVVLNPGIVPGGAPLQLHDYSFLNEISWGLLLLSFALSLSVFLNEQQLQFETFATAEKKGEQVLAGRVETMNPPPANAVPPAPPGEIESPQAEEELMRKFKENSNG